MTIAISDTNNWVVSVLNDLRGRYASRRSAAAEAKSSKAKYWRSLTELNALSNRDLLDIGISRADIPRIAFENSQKERANETA